MEEGKEKRKDEIGIVQIKNKDIRNYLSNSVMVEIGGSHIGGTEKQREKTIEFESGQLKSSQRRCVRERVKY